MSYVATRWAGPDDNTTIHCIIFQIHARRCFVVFYIFSLYKENTKEAWLVLIAMKPGPERVREVKYMNVQVRQRRISHVLQHFSMYLKI